MLNIVREKTKHVNYISDHFNVDERNKRNHEMEQNSRLDVDLSLMFKEAAHFDPCYKSDPVFFSEPWPDLFLD